MDTIGLLDERRLAQIPPQFWRAHEFCFFLHDQIVNALVEYESSGAHQWVADAFQKIADENGVGEDIDVIQFLKEKNLVGYYKHHVISHLVIALAGDMLNFLYEALRCFEKRKFSVAYSLLRKPFKENLLFLCWILGAEDEFISNFEADTYKTLNNVRKEKQLEIFSKAIEMIPLREAFEAELVWNHIYSKNHAGGFEPIWQRATHLITSQGELLKTEDYSINFIFEDAGDDHFYEILYARLPYVMMFLSQVTFECFNKVLSMNERTYSHMTIVTVGCYEVLFSEEKKLEMISHFNKAFKPFLKCIHCSSLIEISQSNALSMYTRDELACDKCGLSSAFPFYWLLARANITIKSAVSPSEMNSVVSKVRQRRSRGGR